MESEGGPTSGETALPGWTRPAGLLVGLAGAAAVLLLAPADLPPQARRAAAVTVLVASFWLFEVLPLAVSSLLPIALLPLSGALDPKSACRAYGDPLVFLMLCGLLLSLAMEKWGLHRRVALRAISVLGGGPERTTLAFMIATAFLSLWVNNTSTTLMMLPIATAVLSRSEGDADALHRWRAGLVLGVAFAASIGGVGTLIGTAPNLIFARAAREAGRTVPFLSWSLAVLPGAVAMLLLTWYALVRWVFPVRAGSVRVATEFVTRDLAALGPLSRGEKAAAAAFAAVAAFWIFQGIPEEGIPGWGDWLPNPRWADPVLPAILAAAALFAVPAGRGERVLEWADARRLPWEVILLFGGGFALAAAIQESGFARWAAARLGEDLRGTPALPALLAVCAATVLLSEVASNTALAAILLPVAGTLGPATGLDPLVPMVAITLSCSSGFMLPVATPPNAIAFATGRVSIREMARAGAVADLLGVLVAAATALWILPRVFGFPALTGG